MARFGAIDITRVYLGRAQQRVPADPGAVPAVRVRLGRAHAPGGSTARSATQCCAASRRATWSGWRSTIPARAASTTRSTRSCEPRDLHGMKIRVPPSDIFMKLVARARRESRRRCPTARLFSALQTHLIDGAENNMRSFHSSRHFEVAQYWSDTRAFVCAGRAADVARQPRGAGTAPTANCCCGWRANRCR